MTIDAHQHFWNYSPVDHAWIGEEMSVLKRDFRPVDLEKELEVNEIDGTVVVQALSREAENAFLVNLSKKYSFIKGIVGWLDLTAGEVERTLVDMKRRFPIIKGFRHTVQDEPDPEFLLRKDFCNGIKLLGRYQYPYDILVYPSQLPATVRFLDQFPDQDFVLDHLGKPPVRSGILTPWKDYLKRIAAHPGVYCKISGLITEAGWDTWKEEDLWPYLEVVWDAFGPERLMFGSDWPVCLLAGSYKRVKEVILHFLERNGIAEVGGMWGGNAVRFYRL